MKDRRTSKGQRNSQDRRQHKRKKTCISGTIINPESTHSAGCIIRDADEKGCMLYSSFLHDFPDDILIHPRGLNKPVMAKIAWRTYNMAGVKFDFDIKPELLIAQ